METKVAAWIQDLNAVGLKLHFVFNGLESGIGSDQAASAARAAQINYDAFSAYEERRPDLTLQALRKGTLAPGEQVKLAFDRGLGVSDTAIVSEMLKKILHERNVPFTVAPYSALAQVMAEYPILHTQLIVHSLCTSRRTRTNLLMLFTGRRSSFVSESIK